jgi:hypothetical protein
MLIDADNAFNRLNRQAALHNIQHTCPEIAPYIINSYRKPASLFVNDELLLSEEGVTQGDNSAMAKYSCSLMPLIRNITLNSIIQNTSQIWYADDAAAGGKLNGLKVWWDGLQKNGPQFGYYPKPSKTWLIVKPAWVNEARKLFPDVKITDVACRSPLSRIVHRYKGGDRKLCGHES